MRAHADPAKRPVWPGTTGPSAGTPARLPSSVRRTSSVDIHFPEPGLLQLRGSGRDLYTSAVGATADLAVAAAVVQIDLATRTIVSCAVEPVEWQTRASGLVGQPAGSRVRRWLQEGMPELVAAGSLLALLLDEIPVAVLISGSSLARRGLLPTSAQQQRRVPLTDVCSGWRAGGDMIRAIEDGSTPFLGEGPPAPPLDNLSDPQAWHAMDALPIGSMRRRRRVDVNQLEDGVCGYAIDVLFRDSFAEPQPAAAPTPVETVVHEYTISAVVDADGTLRSIEATPRVLPGPECPAAAASALRLVGMNLEQVRGHVRDSFSGTSTCTHLNDALRSLGDVHSLLPALW